MIAAAPDRPLGVGTAGPGNFHDTGEAAATASVRAAVAAAWRDAGTPGEPADSIFLGIGGVVTDADRVVATRIAQQIPHAPDACIGVDHDVRIAVDGRGPKRALHTDLLAAVQVDDPRQLMHLLDGEDRDLRERIASLGPAVIAIAQAGDTVLDLV